MPRKTSNKIDFNSLTGKEVELKLTPRAEAFNLAVHGTKACALSARNLIQAAESDWAARSLNERIREAQRKRAGLLAEEPLRDYAYGAAVVEAASSAVDILVRALSLRPAVLGGSEAASKRLPLSTFRVYQDEETLTEALSIAQAEADPVAA